jgi:hypothetical protein
VEGLRVAHPKLRVFLGEEPSVGMTGSASPAVESVTVPLSEVFPLLAEAARSRRAWLSDFADDQITISQDLYEVIVAYQHYRRPAPKAA